MCASRIALKVVNIITSRYGKISSMNNGVSVILGALDNNDSSAIVRCGGTEVACGIYGPTDARGFKDNHRGLIVEVSTRSNVALPTHTHKHIDTIIADIIMRSVDSRSFPHLQLNVHIEVLSDNGRLLSIVGNAVYFALLDSGLPLKHKFVSFLVGYIDEQLVLDPGNDDLRGAMGSVTVFVDIDSFEEIYVTQEDGLVSPDFHEKFSTHIGAFCRSKCENLMTTISVAEPQLRFSR